jgi:general secretion pathway protein F
VTAYRYKALNSQGKLLKGVLEGDSDRQIRAQLRQKQLRPVEVEEASDGRRAGYVAAFTALAAQPQGQ